MSTYVLHPVFYIFRSHWVPFLCPTRSYWPPLSTEKIGLSLSYLVPEIIWPKVGLDFHKNLSFDHFEAFVPIFSLICDHIDALFCSSGIFLTPDFYKTPFFHRLLDPPPKIWWSAPGGGEGAETGIVFHTQFRIWLFHQYLLSDSRFLDLFYPHTHVSGWFVRNRHDNSRTSCLKISIKKCMNVNLGQCLVKLTDENVEPP